MSVALAAGRLTQIFGFSCCYLAAANCARCDSCSPQPHSDQLLEVCLGAADNLCCSSAFTPCVQGVNAGLTGRLACAWRRVESVVDGSTPAVDRLSALGGRVRRWVARSGKTMVIYGVGALRVRHMVFKDSDKGAIGSLTRLITVLQRSCRYTTAVQPMVSQCSYLQPSSQSISTESVSKQHLIMSSRFSRHRIGQLPGCADCFQQQRACRSALVCCN